MATPNDFIKPALEDIGYLAAEIPLEAADANKAFDIFNDMMSEWGTTGILPGAAPVAGLTDTVRVPRFAHAAIKKNLAGLCAAPFRRPITAELAASIKASNESLLRITAKIGDVAFPDTLPTGSGNDCGLFGTDNDRFFPNNVKENF